MIDLVARRRQLPATDSAADAVLAAAMTVMPVALRRKVLLTYLGFPYFDVATLPLLQGELPLAQLLRRATVGLGSAGAGVAGGALPVP